MKTTDEIIHNGKTLTEWLVINKTKDADLSDAKLHGAKLSGANLRGANLRGSNLRGANLRDAKLSIANLSDSNLSDSDLRGADLRGADLRDANLSGADLRGADLSDANLSGADLRGANLSGAKGLLTAREWLKQFKHNEIGVIVYKRIGSTCYPAPTGWVIEPGQFLEEVCNPLPTLNCACGVNFATREWCEREYTKSDLWECIITWQDIADVVVPYNTDGKARCGRLMLVRKI
jgi:hypothetical protein